MILASITLKNHIFLPGGSKRLEKIEPASKEFRGTVHVKESVILIVVPPQSTGGLTDAAKAEAAAYGIDPASLHHIIEIPRSDCTLHWLALPETVAGYTKKLIAPQQHPHPDTHKKPAPPPKAEAPAEPAPEKSSAPPPTRRNPNAPPGWKPPPPPPPSKIIEEDLVPVPGSEPSAG